MIVIAYCFGMWMVWGASLISPGGYYGTGILIFRAFPLSLLLTPVAGWLSFLIVAIMRPAPGGSRVRNILDFWIGGAMLADTIITFLYTALEYADHPENPAGVAPTVGCIMGGDALFAFIVSGIVGLSLQAILARESARDLFQHLK